MDFETQKHSLYGSFFRFGISCRGKQTVFWSSYIIPSQVCKSFILHLFYCTISGRSFTPQIQGKEASSRIANARRQDRISRLMGLRMSASPLFRDSKKGTAAFSCCRPFFLSVLFRHGCAFCSRLSLAFASSTLSPSFVR